MKFMIRALGLLLIAGLAGCAPSQEPAGAVGAYHGGTSCEYVADLFGKRFVEAAGSDFLDGAGMSNIEIMEWMSQELTQAATAAAQQENFCSTDEFYASVTRQVDQLSVDSQDFLVASFHRPYTDDPLDDWNEWRSAILYELVAMIPGSVEFEAHE